MSSPAVETTQLATILDPRVETVEAFADNPALSLPAAEATSVARASTARRREYATTRACARAALELLGRPVEAVPTGPDRAPVWPSGVVGSLTHCSGYRAAAVAHARTHLGMGIDAEPHEALPADVRSIVMSAGERPHGPRDAHLERIVFSAKEAFYKAWNPLRGTWLDFGDVHVEVEPGGGFVATVVGSVALGPVPRVSSGRWCIRSGLILTAVEWIH